MTILATQTLYLKACLDRVNPNANELKRKRAQPGKPYTTHIQRTTKSLLDAIQPAQLNQAPSNETLQCLEAWKHEHVTCRGAKQVVASILDVLEIHADVLRCLDDTTAQRNPVWEDIVHRLNLLHQEDKRRFHYRQLEAAVPLLLSLQPASNPNDSSSWGDLPLESAVDFCTTRRSNPCISVFRLSLLQVTGCLHTRQHLQERVAEAIQLQIRYRALKTHTGLDHGRSTFEDYRALVRRLGFRSYEELQTATAPTVYHALLDMRGKRSSYYLVHEELVRYSRHDVIRYLEMSLPHTYTGLSSTDRILRQPPWVQQVFTDALEFETQASQGRTSYTQEHIMKLRNKISAILTYIHQDTAEQYASQTMAEHPIQWFFEHADTTMISALIRRYGQSRAVRNDLVKSARTRAHHASPEVTSITRYFKGGFRQWLACKDTIDLVNIGHILKTITNRREAADPDTRRTYTDEEVDRILVHAKDPRQELIVTIFREVGLRVSAIGHLRYRMLMSEDGVPRDVCSVPEKGNTQRRFVTSPNLKKRIKVYIDYFRSVLPLGQYQDAYMMNLQDPTSPLSSNRIRGILTELATEAQIAGVHVHPHAFRHTIVGSLIEAGNSMEHVSRFMGHASVDTTSKHYWVATTKELHAQMNNPFMPDFKSVEERKGDTDHSLELQRQKVQTCLQIINTYNLITAKCVDEGLPAIEVQRMLFKSMPDLGSILNDIAMSESASNCTHSASDNEESSDPDN
jgi:site-specific recombinase XerD